MSPRRSYLPAMALAAMSGLAPAADWKQLQNGPRRQGYSPEPIDVPLKNAWAVGLAPERVHPQAQPIIAGGKVLIGTAMGSFRAFDAKTGTKLWSYPAGGPVLHTAGAEGGAVFFGCLDGCIYALNAEDGRLRWRFDSKLRTGFSTAVLLAEQDEQGEQGEKVFIANRGGVYYALGRKDGAVIWRRDLGVPILMSSAMDGGLIFFGAMDMRVYALDAATGQVRWRSEVLHGAAFKDYWPVAYRGLVLVRCQKASGGATGNAIEWHRGPLPQEELDKQAKLLELLEKRPERRDFHVLDQRTGREAMVVPQWTTATMNGAVCPPCVDGDGLLVVPTTLHDWRGGWGRLDIDKRRVVEVLSDGDMEHFAQRKYMRGTGNTDENMLASASGRLVFTIHTEECNAFFTGVWHLDRRQWVQIAPYHAERLFHSNTQGGGGNPVAIADGMVFHTSWNTLNARAAAAAAKGP